MKKLIFLFLLILITLLIYYSNKSDKIYYFSIDNYGYSKNVKASLKTKLSNYVIYDREDYRVMDLINDINDNKEFIYNNKTYTFDNLLVKANFITVSIGIDDLIYKEELSYDYIDQLLSDIEELLKTIRKYNKDKIYFVGFYKTKNMDKYLDYTNKKLKIVCENYNINYIDISNLKTINQKSNLYISDKIINFTKNEK